MMIVQSGSNLNVLKETIKVYENQINLAKANLPIWEKDLELMKKEYEESNWMKTDHTKVFDGLEMGANFNTWGETKKRYKKDGSIGAFYYEDKNSLSDDGLTVQDAKDLVKYLQQKIDYLEEN